MKVLVVGYTKNDAYNELKLYGNGKPNYNRQQLITEPNVTIDWVSLKQHIKDGFQYDEVHVSSLALKHMKPSDLEWIQSLTMKV
ncbi:hypothetical protein EQJ95_03820 [Pediococcus acidilactici]|uniref:hypothetical protein n=1 Tax=Pediococcus acidilactici TaxID=1254 RepID=UPI000FF8E4FC|nr:hypothetical protein [Pediococcus acidilactici]KAF0426000.1 hypothetical protein GBO86_04445 [Pediococcus acidilactici]QAR86602.1 hypothetical protein EQJ95_03820 [Pediococcus acidilactici]UWF33710.1 hypothetical protein NYR25_09035 [Pediococcus acidilactici]DAP19956.1 MAG TPA: hypothetical protein [Caudoviricetes sp.]